MDWEVQLCIPGESHDEKSSVRQPTVERAENFPVNMAHCSYSIDARIYYLVFYVIPSVNGTYFRHPPTRLPPPVFSSHFLR